MNGLHRYFCEVILVDDDMYGKPMDAVSVSSVDYDLIALWVSAWRAMKEILDEEDFKSQHQKGV